MTEREIKFHLGEQVRFRNERLHVDGIYTLTAATIRKGAGGFYYQAEIMDPCNNALLIVNLQELQTIGEQPERNES